MTQPENSTAADTVPAAQLNADAPDPAGQAIAPDATETLDSGELVDDTDADEQPDPGDDDTADTFPRSVVEKLRKESAGLRDRFKVAEGRAETAEERLATVQRQLIGRQVASAGLKPAAVFAVAQLDDLLAEDGTVDADRVVKAIAAARDTLGVGVRRNPVGRGSFQSGASGTNIESLPKGFASAFRRSED